MLTIKQRLEKMLAALRKLDPYGDEAARFKSQLIGYIESWMDELEDPKNEKSR